MNKNMSEESHKKIFISHSSKDKQIVDIFVDKLLHLGLQIDPNDVAYTSREETGVGTGEDIRKFIKENISTCDFVFFMISENYKKSEICLNEMGAAWATDRTVIPLVFPNLSFDSIGWLYNVRKGLLLNDPDALDSIFDDIMAVANDMDDIATLYDESAPKIITIFGEIIDWGVKLQQYDLGDNNEQIKAENREALHSLVIAVLTGKNALINGRNELTKIIGIEKHQKRAQRRLTESYTKIIEAFEKCTIKANDMANA